LDRYIIINTYFFSLGIGHPNGQEGSFMLINKS